MKSLKNITVQSSVYLLFIQLFFICPLQTYAQNQRTVTGVVSDVQGVPLIGVNIQVKDLKVGTVTDLNGTFKISIPSTTKNAVLLISYIGYNPVEVAVENKSNLQVTLKENAKDLDEVIVVGYGKTTKRDLTGSVAKADVSEMLKSQVTGFDQAMQGRIAGVQIMSTEGQPGTDADIVIRGANSLTQDNSPLYVVDGFPIESSLSNAIDPGDIESIEVLKDASATAIYGARGANGVILITSKKGKAGSSVISYDGSYGFQSVTKKMDLMNGYEFVKLQSELLSNTSLINYYFKDTGVVDFEQYRGVGTDLQDYLFKTAPTQTHRFALRGGNSSTKHSLSVSYNNQEGVIINSGYNRLQGRLTLDHQANKWMKLGVTANYSHSKRYGALPSEATYDGTQNLLQNTWAYRPVSGSSNFDLLDEMYDPAIDSNNNYRVNPIISAQNEVKNKYENNLITNGYIELDLPFDLKFRSTIGYVLKSQRYDQFNNSNTRSGNLLTSKTGVNGSVSYTDKDSWSNENTLTYARKFNKKHSVEGLIGMTTQHGSTIYNSISMQFIPNEELVMSGIDEGSYNSMSAIRSDWSLMSYLARFNYNYNYKYYLTASIRADGSSKFPINNRWGYFPSASVMWRFSKENIFKNLEFISDGKARLSWGVTGNNRVDDFAYYSQITSNAIFKYYYGNTAVTGSAIEVLGNENLKWEETKQTDLGIDLSLFNSRLSITADYYYKLTDNLLLQAELPGSTGYEYAYKNIGKVSNSGIELTVSTQNIKKKHFNWTTDFNIAWNKSKILSLTENQTTLSSAVKSLNNTWSNIPAYIARVNEPMGLIYGYIYEGTYKYDDFTKTGSTYTLKPGIPYIGAASSIQPGDMKYSDLNGDGIINDYDRTVIGRGTPIHTGGINNNFQIDNFDISMFFQWSYGNDVINANKYMFLIGNTAHSNMFAEYVNRFSETNPDSDLPRVNCIGGTVYSTFAVEDASYLRFKNFTVGYTLPKSISEKISLSKLRVYGTVDNLWTFTGYSGMDPEVSVRHTALTPGFDFSAYPRARTITFGVNLILK